MKKNVKSVIGFIIKLLKAILYVLSAGHLCSCKHHEEEAAAKEENGTVEEND